MSKKDTGKPKGRTSMYAYFVQCCREEHKKKHPGEHVVFAEFTRKCAQKWKQMNAKEKQRFVEMAEKDKLATRERDGQLHLHQMNAKDKQRFEKMAEKEKSRYEREMANYTRQMNAKEKQRFEEMAEKDKSRYEREMANYTPAAGGPPAKGKKRTKDPNAPKRALSAFFIFCAEERPKVRAIHPKYTVGEIAKELGRRWEGVSDRSKFNRLAAQEKAKYEVAMEAYKAGQASPKKAAGRSPAKKQRVEESEEEEEDEEEEEEEEEDDEDDDE